MTKNFILMVVWTNLSENEPNRTIWQWVIAYFVIFHKSRFSARNADFFLENHPYFAEILLFCIFAHHCRKYTLSLCFDPICSLFGPFLSELEPFLAPMMPYLGHFYIGFYIRKVQFSDIPGRTRMAIESRHANIFSFRKKIWWARCQ